MRMVDLIAKKKVGNELSTKEINYIVEGYTKGTIPDYQMSAFLMCVYYEGMNKREISDLTNAYVNSGDITDLSSIEGVKVDKHSTGGVGDKISLIVIPLAACLGIPVAKMSGRGLGHTGGTIDKLESIEGFNTQMSKDKFISNVNKYKMAIVSQTENLTPADKKTYALRDVTSAVDSIPLIAASIMSKKIASGADAIVLDVKVGSGAFMKTIENARELSRTMVDIGLALGRKTIAVITDMSQPLGHEVGNANEVKEAISVLNGKGPEDVTNVALTIASYMAVLGKVSLDFDIAYNELENIINSGKAIEKFKKFIEIQGGNSEIVDKPEMLPSTKHNIKVIASEDGYVNSIDAEKIGASAMLLGAGRKTKDDKIDFAAGLTLCKKVCDKVNKGDTLCILHTNLEDYIEAQNVSHDAYFISNNEPQKINCIHEIIF